MATKWYGKAAQAVASGKIDLLNGDIKVMLVGSTYSPDQDNHGTVADVTGEVSDTAYTAGGESLTGKTLTQDATKDKWTWDADDVTWTGITATFRYAVLYDNTDPTKPLIAYVDFGSNQTATAQDLTIKWEYVEIDEYSQEPIATHYGILEVGY